MTDHMLEKVENGVATLTMNRPEARNAMSGEMLEALTDALKRHAADRSIRAVVLTGAGDAFCAVAMSKVSRKTLRQTARVSSILRSGSTICAPAWKQAASFMKCRNRPSPLFRALPRVQVCH